MSEKLTDLSATALSTSGSLAPSGPLHQLLDQFLAVCSQRTLIGDGVSTSTSPSSLSQSSSSISRCICTIRARLSSPACAPLTGSAHSPSSPPPSCSSSAYRQAVQHPTHHPWLLPSWSSAASFVLCSRSLNGGKARTAALLSCRFASSATPATSVRLVSVPSMP